MQGKERNNRQVDEAFVSEAWESMSHMLDEVMPVEAGTPVIEQERGNNKWLMLLLLLVGFGAGSSGMYWYTQSSNKDVRSPLQKEESQKASAKTPIATIESKSLNTNTTTEINTTIQSKKTEKNQNLSSSTSEKENLDWQSKLLAATPTKRKDPVQFKWAPANTLIAGNKDNVILGGEDAGSSPTSLPKENSKELIKSQSKTSPTSLSQTASSVAALPTLDINLLTENPAVFNPTKIILPKTPKWAMGISATTIRDDGTKEFGGGFSFGLLVDRRLDNRFSIQSGIHWHHLKKISNSNSTNNIFASNLSQIQGQSNFNLVSLLDFSSANAPIKNLDYLKVPLQLSFKFNKQLRFHTGAHLAYLLSPLNTSQTRDTDLPPFETLTPEEKVNLLADTRSKLARKGLAKIDFGLQVGLGYYPTKRLGIIVNYNIGFKDFSNDEYFGFRETHTNQYLQLGLNYFFINR